MSKRYLFGILFSLFTIQFGFAYTATIIHTELEPVILVDDFPFCFTTTSLLSFTFAELPRPFKYSIQDTPITSIINANNVEIMAINSWLEANC